MNTESPFDNSRPQLPRDDSVEGLADAMRRARLTESAEAPQHSFAGPSQDPGHGLPPEAVQREEFEALSSAVLEAAEVASQAALAASIAGRDLKSTAEVISGVSAGLGKRSIWALGILAGLLVLSIGLFSIMAARMISKTNRLDATLVAVGKRVVELDAGLTGLSAIQENMDALADRVATLTKAQAELGQRVDTSVQQSTALVQQVPEKTAKQVATTSSDLLRQVQSLGGRLQAQAGAVQAQSAAVHALGEEVKALKGSLSDIAGVKRDVQALVTLQRERYLEVLQKQGQVASDANALRFPRPQPSRSGAMSAAPAANSVAPTNAGGASDVR